MSSPDWKVDTLQQSDLEELIAILPDGVVLLDRGGNIILVNPAAQKLLKSRHVQEASPLNRPFWHTIGQAQWAELLEQTGEGIAAQIKIAGEDGKLTLVQSIQLLKGDMLILLKDISRSENQKHTENEFVHSVSHDLRSPLTTILGYTELVERVGPVNEMQSNFIQHVKESVAHMTHMLDDLVNLKTK
jgi:two-component system, OmpR family, phosphate regulon sensor histidine kinase PhoR